MVGLGLATPGNLLLFTFLIGAAGALTIPAWQAVVPQLVPKDDLPPAIAANSVGVNISRAIGPALGGVIIAAIGIAAPFWINAISNLGIVGALLWWRESETARTLLPAERFGRAMATGLRYARHNPHLRATLVRAAGFFLFASAYWALLPLVARSQIAGGPELYGILLGVIGAGAVSGAFLLPWLKIEARSGPADGVGRARPGAGDGALRHRPRARDRARGERARRRVMDRGARDAERVGAGGVAGLGARPRACAVHHGVLRLPDARQRGLGRGRRVGRLAGGAFSRRGRRGRGHTADVALEAANRQPASI